VVEKSQRDRIIASQKGKCARCPSEGPFEIDHIIATALGGTTVRKNLQALCKPCHREKTREDLQMVRATDGRKCVGCQQLVFGNAGVAYISPTGRVTWYHERCDEAIGHSFPERPIPNDGEIRYAWTDQFRSELLRWVRQRPGGFVSNRDLYAWHVEQSEIAEREPLSERGFGLFVSQIFPMSKPTRKMINGHALWGRPGLMIVPHTVGE